jgi:hydrogenase maturation protease
VNAPALASPPAAVAPPAKILLLGLGNDILSDDAVGLSIAREIRRRLSDSEGIEVRESSEMGLSLLDEIAGFDDLVLVDAIQTGQAPPGFVHQLDGDDLRVLPGGSPHFVGVGEMLALGRRLGLPVPRRVQVFAVEVKDPFTVGESMTSPLLRAFPAVVELVLGATRRLRDETAAS